MLHCGAKWVTFPISQSLKGFLDCGIGNNPKSKTNRGTLTLVFTGTYEHSIDSKNRVAIPAEIRTLLARQQQARSGGADNGPITLYVSLSDELVLCLYTQEMFEQRAAELDRSELETGEILEYERMLYSMSGRAELDSQGRIRLPENLLEMTELKNDVVLIGVKDHMEVRDRETWLAYRTELLKRKPQLLMNPRRAMKKPQSASMGDAGAADKQA